MRDVIVRYKCDLSGCISSTTMAFSLDQFTDKARETVQAAVQLATDYANSQCTSSHPLHHFKRSCMYSVPCAPCVCTLERRCWRWSDHRKHFTISNSPLCIRDPKSRRRCHKYISLISCPCVCIYLLLDLSEACCTARHSPPPCTVPTSR